MNQIPNLFIVGAAKCGTTSLYEYLNEHPDIYMCPVKEPHFFSNVQIRNKEVHKDPEPGKYYMTKVIRSTEIYLSLFKEGLNCKIRGEASPSYLFDTNA